MRVGLLEDDTAIQEMFLLVLEDEGYEVTTYESARECLHLLGVAAQAAQSRQSSAPSLVDLVIVDWRLNGDISGLDVIRQIRADERLNSLPIILTTAATADVDIHELLQLHVALLEKPFAVDDVTYLIKRLTRPGLTP